MMWAVIRTATLKYCRQVGESNEKTVPEVYRDDPYGGIAAGADTSDRFGVW